MTYCYGDDSIRFLEEHVGVFVNRTGLLHRKQETTPVSLPELLD